MGILNVQSVGNGTGSYNTGSSAQMLSPLMHLLAGEIGNKMEQRRANQMSPETAKNMNQLLGIPETVKTPGQAEGPTEPGVEAPTGIANTPNPEAFTTSSMKGFTRPQQATLTSQVIEKKLSPTLTAQNNKLLADKAYGELLSNDNLKGYQRSGLEKILSGDPGAFKDYEKQTNNQATGYSMPEYSRIKNIPGQEENAADLKSYILSMNPDYGKSQPTAPIMKDGKTYIGMRDSLGDITETDKETMNMMDAGVARAKAYADHQLKEIYEPETGETKYVPGKQAIGQMSASTGVKMKNKDTMFSEINTSLDRVHNDLQHIQISPSLQTLAQEVISKAGDHGAVRTLIDKQLTGRVIDPSQAIYLTNLANLAESSMSLRMLGSMGQGSDAQREALIQALPGMISAQPEAIEQAYSNMSTQLRLLRGSISPRIQKATDASAVNGAAHSNGQVTTRSGNKFTIVGR